jgi:TolA-binding protein
LSAGRDDKGSYSIDPAELFRVYEPKKDETVAAPAATEVAEGGVVHDATPISGFDATEIRVRNAQLEEQIKGLQTIVEMERQRAEHERQRAEDARQRAEELRAERESWKQQAERLAIAGPNLVPAQNDVRGWWPWRRRA